MKWALLGKQQFLERVGFGNLPEHRSPKVSRKEELMGACHGHDQHLVHSKGVVWSNDCHQKLGKFHHLFVTGKRTVLKVCWLLGKHSPKGTEQAGGGGPGYLWGKELRLEAGRHFPRRGCGSQLRGTFWLLLIICFPLSFQGSSLHGPIPQGSQRGQQSARHHHQPHKVALLCRLALRQGWPVPPQPVTVYFPSPIV